MTQHRIFVLDGGTVEESVESEVEEQREEYIVVNALFKNGKTIDKGKPIELTPKAAKAFLEAGDIRKKEKGE